VAGLADLVQVSNQYTGIMLALLWLAVPIGWRMLNSRVQDNGEQIDSLADDHDVLESKVQRVDLKQDHVQKRQEVIMDRVGVNENQIQEMRRASRQTLTTA